MPELMAILPIHRGQVWHLLAWGDERSCEIVTFLAMLERNQPYSFIKLWAEIRRAGDHGPSKNKEKSRPLAGRQCDGIFEFKTPQGARILWFYDKNYTIVMTHGFLKGNVVNTECEKAKRIQKLYLAEKGHDT